VSSSSSSLKIVNQRFLNICLKEKSIVIHVYNKLLLMLLVSGNKSISIIYVHLIGDEYLSISATVVFQATGIQKTSGYSINETVIFPTVTYNEGAGYNSSTGMFTAPVSGLYAFAKQMCEAASTYSYTAFVHNGQSVLSSMNQVSNFYSCQSAQVFVQMASGDQMWVMIVGSSSHLYYEISLQTSFSGSLMHG